MATHSGILAWRMPWTEEPGGLQSIGSQRVGHDGSNSTCRRAYRIDRKAMAEGAKQVIGETGAKVGSARSRL